jgi:predicted metal-dependent peptidase
VGIGRSDAGLTNSLTGANVNLQRSLNRARWWLMENQPFYGNLACGLADEFGPVGTACTDGRRIKWDPDFLSTLSEEEVRAVLIHETLHCGHGHLWRLPIDNESNLACDYVVNEIVAQIEGCKLPKVGAMCPPEYKGMAEEEIYGRLKKKPPQEGTEQGQGRVPGGSRGHKPGMGDFEAPAQSQNPGNGTDSLETEWQERMIQAGMAAQSSGQGSIPADMQRQLDKLKAQKADWRQELADFVRNTVGTRNDWSRPNRRSATQPVIYPRKRRDQLATVIFARDTSGSITDAVAAQYSAVVTAILADVGCAGIVLDCDAQIKAEVHLAPGEECPLRADGGGGTDFRPIFERAAQLQEKGEQIAGVVYLTDLMGTYPEMCELPTLWITESGQAPFGRTVVL